MARVGDSAMTPHGRGQITEVDQVRGRGTIYRVAGRGFHAWVDEVRCHVANDDPALFSAGPMRHELERSQHGHQHDYGSQADMDYVAGLDATIEPASGNVNERNTTVLPWDPTPQHPVDMFAKEQTILPGEHEIDLDDRLHPTDSLSGERTESNRPYPGPNPDLFAKSSAFEETDPERPEQYDDEWSHDFNTPERTLDHRAASEPHSPWHETHDEDAYHDPHVEGYDEFNSYDRHHHGALDPRPAGLSDRYAHVSEEYDHHDPITAFRRDPVGFITTCGHLWTDGDEHLDHKYADYSQLIDVDPTLREAAWSDVRTKAMRLRHEGKVQVNDLGAGRIHATVEGDHGTYNTMIVKGSYGGLGGGQSIKDWVCSCEWGRWAFKRQMTYVGRLCSHGYATYLEMQAKEIGPEHFAPQQKKSASITEDYKSWLDDNNQTPEAASVAAFLHTTGRDDSTEQGHTDARVLYDYISDHPDEVPERDYDIDYTNDPDKAYKDANAHEADRLLRTRPESMSPNLREVPKGEQQWMDVTKDEREDTGPEDIVHFSSVDTLRLLHGSEEESDKKRRPDVAEASGLLDRLREMSDDHPEDHYGDMAAHNEEISELVEKLQDAGIDASQMVASLHHSADDEDPSLGKADFAGPSAVDWADEPFAGSGPDPKEYISDSAGYVKENEAPHYQDLTSGDGDIVKFNDSRSKPQQGPKQGSYDHTAASLHEGLYEDDTGYFNPNNRDDASWEAGSGDEFMNEVNKDVQQATPKLPGGKGGDGGEAGAGEAAAGEEAAMIPVVASAGGFSVEAFDRGEFLAEAGPASTVRRAGKGAHQEVRIDPGVRRGAAQRPQLQQPPEDFGFDGGREIEAYLQDDSGGSDIVADFHRSAAAGDVLGQGGGSHDDFSSSPFVQSMLRTAGRKYSPEEQRELEAEFHPLGARNLPTEDDLAGTHYLML